MSNCCICGWCHNSPTKTKPIRFLKGLHNCCILSGQIVASAILICLTLWLFFRVNGPSAYVNNFVLGTHEDRDSKLVHYNITVHNPDIYKSITYDSFTLRIQCQPCRSRTGVTVNVKGFDQGPGKSRVLNNHTADTGYAWIDYWKNIEDGYYSFDLKIMMNVRYKFLNKVIASRQITRVAMVYFDGTGHAFIDSTGGLPFK